MSAAIVSSSTTRSEDVQRWMQLERDIKTRSVRYQEEKAQRLEEMRGDDARRIREVFDLFDYDKHKYLPVGDLSMILKAVGCDDRTSETTQLADLPADAQAFTLEQLLPVALDALAVGRDGSSEESTRAAFYRFCTRSHKYNPATAASASNNEKYSSSSAPSANNTNNSDPHAASPEGVLALDVAGLKAAFLHCGARVSDEEIVEILEYADLDGDGVVGEADWMAVMQFVMETQ